LDTYQNHYELRNQHEKPDHNTASEAQQNTYTTMITMKTMKPTTHHVREDEKHETKRKNNTKAACDEINTT
jgi:hypothetical protein